MRRPALVLALALSIAVASASAAQAEQRFAAPAGAGVACTESQPCLLAEAVTKAKTGDEVIVGSGTHTLSGPLQTPLGVENLDIHGAAGGAMPTIVASVSYPDFALEFRGSGGRLGFLAIEETSPTFAQGVRCTSGGRVERVRISTSGGPAIGLLQGENCALRDSLVLAAGSQAKAILATGGSGVHSGLARNVTAVGTGLDSSAIISSYSGGEVFGSYTLDAKNVIASGEGWDLRTGGGDFGVGHFQISNSNFETTNFMPGSTISGSANQSAPPLFVDPLGGDYHVAAGSPTIDAGATDQLGASDLDGSPRAQGSAPDIGAYEFPSPSGPAGPAAPPVAKLESLAVAPRMFRVLRSGEAVAGARKAPRGTTVTYRVSVSTTVEFRVERKLRGRMVRGRCVKQTRANRTNRPCPRFKGVGNSFSHLGAAGENRFTFSGRLSGRPLRPGAYRLVGSAGGVKLTAPFRIVE
jgi:hypothetical protein